MVNWQPSDYRYSETAAEGRGRPQLQIVQIPLLTEWLLWVAEAMRLRLNPMGRDYLWESPTYVNFLYLEYAS